MIFVPLRSVHVCTPSVRALSALRGFCGSQILAVLFGQLLEGKRDQFMVGALQDDRPLIECDEFGFHRVFAGWRRSTRAPGPPTLSRRRGLTPRGSSQ